MPDDLRPSPRTVTATLNYLKPVPGGRPRRYVEAPPAGEPASTIEPEPHLVAIADARGREDAFTLDRHGFAWLDAPSRAGDLRDPAVVESAYRPEVEALLRDALGAARVVMFDHTIRGPRRADAPLREPVKRVHNDYTWESGPQRVRDLLPAEADALLARRFAIVNLWRPIGRPVEESPLALCDAQSMAERDLVVTELVYPNRVGQTFSVLFNPAHRWWYLARQRPEEALLIKCYDSATDGRARLSAHGAFDDPETPPDAPPRESIEVRTLVFW
ncbi:MAG TPA: CmcJ/NvfI family oxidoreductase [Crenalkalicoccus sp.]|jgi:hypothetical protein|nr:CmcJ/NvfI family oxidoreductase [Crenalkalicoccus sp.]